MMMTTMREGVRGVYALYYTHRGGIFNTSRGWLKSSKRAVSTALKSQTFLVERGDSLQACALLHTHISVFVRLRPSRRRALTKDWLGLQPCCTESCSLELKRTTADFTVGP